MKRQSLTVPMSRTDAELNSQIYTEALPEFLPPAIRNRCSSWLSCVGKDVAVISNDTVIYKGVLSVLHPDNAGSIFSPFMVGNTLGLKWSDTIAVYVD